MSGSRWLGWPPGSRPPGGRGGRSEHDGPQVHVQGDVGGDERAADPGGRFLARLFVEVGNDHVHALGRQPIGDSSADPGGGAGHQRGSSVKVHARIVRPGTDISTR